jgi:hypothetical protein
MIMPTDHTRKHSILLKLATIVHYQVPVKLTDGTLLEDDEFIMTKTGMVENPARFEKGRSNL